VIQFYGFIFNIKEVNTAVLCNVVIGSLHVIAYICPKFCMKKNEKRVFSLYLLISIDF